MNNMYYTPVLHQWLALHTLNITHSMGSTESVYTFAIIFIRLFIKWQQMYYISDSV